MRVRNLWAALGLALAVSTGANGQHGTTSARVETAPLELIPPERFQMPVMLEPIRRVSLVAPADGIIRELPAKVDDQVRERAEIALFDRTEAQARLKVAQAAVKEMQAALEAAQASTPKSKPVIAGAEARLEAAKARAELEQFAIDACTLRAPFAGRIMAVDVSDGQYLPKGGEVAELADLSSLRALVPVDRKAVQKGGQVKLTIEGKPATARVLAIMPLPETFAALRELAAPLGAAWVQVANPGELEPGQRVLSPFVPNGSVATVPTRAIHESSESTTGSVVQVIRNDYVTEVPVRVLGAWDSERSQISGPFRQNDTLIVGSSVPLLVGSLIRFGGGSNGTIEGHAPQPGEAGEVAGVTPPAGRTPPGVAPIGAPGSAIPKPGATSRPVTRPSTAQPKSSTPSRPSGGGNAVPF